ncbi:MAG: DUF4405 domain-containing protein [Sulfurospirillaceae bacterium]|nr:DUF4405 domain-containing protein [Sulfurospirillaceae bacterium]MDD2825606.1 DUF4405 domain-containing protein [Sulfurospirillaceae bacterium]
MNSLRRFISLCITLSFLIMSYTGILLFISPKGRVANWTNWELFGLDKTQYTNLHVSFMVLFLIGMMFHLYLNWSPLICYLKNKARTFSLLTKEFLFAFGINLLFIVGTLYYWTPFDQFLDFQDDVKASWEQKANKAPYGHAELSNIKDFSEKTGANTADIVAQLTAKKLKGVDLEKSIAQIARENGRSPAQLFEMIDITKKNNSNATTSTTMVPLKEGGGYGKLTLQTACEQYALEFSTVQTQLKEKGFEANPTNTLREIADALHVSPIELLDMLRKP